jgi:hypothetical protein
LSASITGTSDLMEITPVGFNFSSCATVFIGFLHVDSHRSNTEPPRTGSDSDAQACDILEFYAYCRQPGYRIMPAPTVLLLGSSMTTNAPVVRLDGQGSAQSG